MHVTWSGSIGRPTGSTPRQPTSSTIRWHRTDRALQRKGAIVKRGDLYRVHKPHGDPKSHRVFVVVSRQALIDSRFSTVVCAPVFTAGEGLSTQVAIGPAEGLKHPSWIMCDNLVSLRKTDLTQYIWFNTQNEDCGTQCRPANGPGLALTRRLPLIIRRTGGTPSLHKPFSSRSIPAPDA